MPREGNQNAVRHGNTSVDGVFQRSPTYSSWRCMKERCYYDKHKWFHAYGGRGIKVCDRWLGKQGFANFLADMGERPAPEMSIDRIDVNLDYMPTKPDGTPQCKWSTKSEQRKNQRPFAKRK